MHSLSVTMHPSKSKCLPLLLATELTWKPKEIWRCSAAYICLPWLSPAAFREHNPALWQPPRRPTHDRAGERQDGPGPQPGGEQGPVSHERLRGGDRPQWGSRQGWSYGGRGWAARGKNRTHIVGIWLLKLYNLEFKHVIFFVVSVLWSIFTLGEKSVYNSIFFFFLPSQINGQVLYGHTHQNASSIIKSSLSKVKIIFVRYGNTFVFILKLLWTHTGQQLRLMADEMRKFKSVVMLF